MKKVIKTSLTVFLIFAMVLSALTVANAVTVEININTEAAFRSAVSDSNPYIINLTGDISLGNDTPVTITKLLQINGNGYSIYGRIVASTGADLTLSNVTMSSSKDVLRLDNDANVYIHGGSFQETAVYGNAVYASNTHTGILSVDGNAAFTKTSTSATSATFNLSGKGNYYLNHCRIYAYGQNRAIETYNDVKSLTFGCADSNNKCIITCSTSAPNMIRISSLGTMLTINPSAQLIGDTTSALILISRTVSFIMNGGLIRATGTKDALSFNQSSWISMCGGTLQSYGGDSMYITSGGIVNISGSANIINLTGGCCINTSQQSSPDITVSGGEFAIGTNKSAIKVQGYTANVEISGGTFNSTSTASGPIVLIDSNSTANLTVTGGQLYHNGSGDTIKHIGSGNVKMVGVSITHFGSGAVLNVTDDGVANRIKAVTLCDCHLTTYNSYTTKYQCTGTGSKITVTTDPTNVVLTSLNGNTVFTSGNIMTKSIDYTDYRSALNTKSAYKNNILGTTGDSDTSDITGTIYYVSSSLGSDSNGGTSKNSPFKTISKAMSEAISGDAILLKRGDTWRTPANSVSGYILKQGILYGAYGLDTAQKPQIFGSVDNYSGSDNWTNVDGNIWRASIKGGSNPLNMAGNVYLFYNEFDDTPAVIGRSVNVAENAQGGTRFTSESQLEKEGDIYSVEGSGYVYLFCNENPGLKYERIEVAEKRDLIQVGSNTVIDNLSIKYAGGNGINGGSLTNVQISNCEVGYIGGATLVHDGITDVYGNGIQFGQAASNVSVCNCYVYQCYDAGITFQRWDSATGGSFTDISFTDNLLENNFYNIEFWSFDDGLMQDIYIADNILSEAGYCWSWNQRQSIGNTKMYAANIYGGRPNALGIGSYNHNSGNSITICDNIFDTTRANMVCWFWTSSDSTYPKHQKVYASSNSYFQRKGSFDDYVMNYGYYLRQNGNQYAYSATGQTGLEYGIHEFEDYPSTVLWLESF